MDYDLIRAKKIMSPVKDNGWWFKYDYNINIYRGCSHGCIYCDSRSECYGIDNFDKIQVKENAIELLQTEVAKKRKKGIVGFGSMSDPYNPIERELQMTRHALEILCDNGFGVCIFTKSDLILRDLDILKEINRFNSVLICITVTTADDKLCKIIEPNVMPSSARLRAVKVLSEAGIFVGITMMPILPFVNDNAESIEILIEKSYECGAQFIYPMFGVTMRANQREYFYNKIDEYFPHLSDKYKSRYGNNYYCAIPDTKIVEKQFSIRCREKAIPYDMKTIIEGYCQKKDIFRQINMLDK